MKQITVVILAGGIGRRFVPFTLNKTLFPFLGKPLLQHTIENVLAGGFSDILVVTSSENDEWVKEYSESTQKNIRHIIQNEPWGMGNALFSLQSEIGTNPCLVINAVDIVGTTLFSSLFSYIEKNDPYGLTVGKKMDTYFSGGYIVLKDEKAIGVIEKPKPDQRQSTMVKLVFDYFSKPHDFIDRLKSVNSPADDQYEQILTSLMQEQQFDVFSYDDLWQKLTYTYTVLSMMDMFATTLQPFIDPTARISPQASLSGNVYVDEGAIVHEGAVIKGPCYIGKRAIIGNHTLVRHSFVESESVIGFGSEVSRSYIGPRCKLHHNYIGDSILESDINPSYGTCTANMRLDGNIVFLQLPQEKIDTGRAKLGAVIAKGVFCGIHCSLMPGVTIGANAKIYPGVVVSKPVEENEVRKK